MDILCRTGRHSRSLERPIWNHGYWFSSCRRCGCDLVRRGGGRWRVPPKGYKVVWKARRRDEIDWNGLLAWRPQREAEPRLPLLEAMNDDSLLPEPKRATPPTDVESQQLPA